MKATIRNTSISPYEFTALSGSITIPAGGSAYGDFDEQYLAMLDASAQVIIERDGLQATVEPQAAVQEKAGEETSQEDVYFSLAGRHADRRWSAARLAAEINALQGK